MACISRRASTSVIFPAVARALSASRRQWSASYVGCTTSPHLPPPSRERQIFRSVPNRNFNNGYGIFHAGRRARTWNWRLFTNWRARTSAAKFITIARERVHRTHELCGRCDRVRHYPTVSANAIPTLTADRPPTINASQAISRTSDAIDLHIAALPPVLCR